MALVRCYPIGIIIMEDQGYNDEKVIAIPYDDPTYNNYSEISELPRHIFEEMVHFFSVYKTLEGKEIALKKISGHLEAERVINKSIDSYKIKFGR